MRVPLLFLLALGALAAFPDVGEPSPSPLKDWRIGGPCTEGTEPFCAAVAVGTVGRWHCSGVVVGPRAVLTAAHCLPATQVAVGGDVASPDRVVQVARVHRPPPALDAALLELDEPLGVALSESWTEAGPPGGETVAVGFGSPDARSLGRFKEAVRLRVGVGWGCDGWTASAAGCRPGLELVANSERGKDTCNGDSGGPLYAWRDDAWVLVGITSRPVRSSLVACGDGGIFVRIDRLMGWLAPLLEEAG